jgi:hypothetical protein
MSGKKLFAITISEKLHQCNKLYLYVKPEDLIYKKIIGKSRKLYIPSSPVIDINQYPKIRSSNIRMNENYFYKILYKSII